MKTTSTSMLLLLLTSTFAHGQDISTFKAYVDSDICARLMLGPINAERVACSQTTYKEGSTPVLVQLSNNTLFDVDRQKTIKNLVGQLVEVSGQVKEKNATIKLTSVNPIQAASLASDDPGRRLLDVRAFRAPEGPRVFEAVRHELAMMPYITEFDFISFTMVDSDVILTGWTVRSTNRKTAENRVKAVEGVGRIINNIDILPLGKTDMQIRAAARFVLQQRLPRYFWGNGSDIKIIVKNGNIILLGSVEKQSESDLAYLQCTGVPLAFNVFNLLRVRGDEGRSE